MWLQHVKTFVACRRTANLRFPGTSEANDIVCQGMMEVMCFIMFALLDHRNTLCQGPPVISGDFLGEALMLCC